MCGGLAGTLNCRRRAVNRVRSTAVFYNVVVKSYDVIIVGGGIIGLSLAIALRKGGARVLVVEKGEPGREASHAAAGMLVLGIPEDRIITIGAAEGDDVVRDRLFRALVLAAPDVMLSAGRRHALLREPVAEHLIRDTSRVNAQFAAVSSLPANIPILAITAFNEAEELAEARAAGCLGCIIKPFTEAALAEAVSSVLGAPASGAGR